MLLFFSYFLLNVSHIDSRCSYPYTSYHKPIKAKRASDSATANLPTKYRTIRSA